MSFRDEIINKTESRPFLNGLLRIFLLYGVRTAIVNIFPKGSKLHSVASILVAGKFPVLLEYPVNPRPRYGWGESGHKELTELVEKNRAQYAQRLEAILKYQNHFSNIKRSVENDKDMSPQWIQDMLPPEDAVILYSILAENKPKRYFEIGSGNSTRFARKAIDDHSLETTIYSIDPYPRVGIDKLCHRLDRTPLETVDLSFVDELEQGDILFIDNSHYAFTNSDVTICFMEILPRLRRGVLIHVHDIFIPRDYPSEWNRRWYAEQYLLAASLLFGQSFETYMPNNFVHFDTELSKILAPMWKELNLSDSDLGGLPDKTGPAGFWMRKTV